jgi:DNA-binding response OmpR family regulator
VHILLVEDNRRLARYLKRALQEEGYAVEMVHDGDEGLAVAMRGSFDAIVLDVMLPSRNGLELMSVLREKKKTPILLISARGEMDDRVNGLNQGADDFLPKPFAIEEFKARVRALLRRNVSSEPLSLTCGDLRMDLLQRKVFRGDAEVQLTAKEFSLLEYLMRNQGRVLGKTLIAEHVWGYSFDWESNIIEVFINQLRNKMDRDLEPRLIHTLRGVGYMLKADA